METYHSLQCIPCISNSYIPEVIFDLIVKLKVWCEVLKSNNDDIKFVIKICYIIYSNDVIASWTLFASDSILSTRELDEQIWISHLKGIFWVIFLLVSHYDILDVLHQFLILVISKEYFYIV
jgi:hypothetical protein